MLTSPSTKAALPELSVICLSLLIHSSLFLSCCLMWSLQYQYSVKIVGLPSPRSLTSVTVSASLVLHSVCPGMFPSHWNWNHLPGDSEFSLMPLSLALILIFISCYSHTLFYIYYIFRKMLQWWVKMDINYLVEEQHESPLVTLL